MEYITEAFKSLNILDEDVFDISSDGIEKAKEFMDADAQEVETVIDPFMGVGACGVACKNLNRKFIGIELDENYFNIAKERIENT